VPSPSQGNLTDLFPKGDAVPGWHATSPAATYDQETLFDLVNGQADAFFAYNFRQVAVQSYENGTGDSIRVELWQLGSAADAYGLFSRNAAGESAEMGNDAEMDPGRRLAFWQDRYYVQVRANQVLPEADILAFATAIADALPRGGERPALLEELPATASGPRRRLFFRQEISVQDEVWLGGENILALDSQTLGALGEYSNDNETAYLLIIQYADGDAARQAMESLTTATIDGLVAATTSGKRLAAVFGSIEPAEAEALLSATED
jgi:hypothetical protein